MNPVTNNLRIVPNYDWVIFTLIGCAFLYIFLFNFISNNRNVKGFLLEEFSGTSNIFFSWLVISLIYVILLATLISYFVPIVPKWFLGMSFLGLQINKFGFTLLVIIFYYLLKSLFTALFFWTIQCEKKWPLLYFVSSKLYYVYSILVFIGCIVLYFLRPNLDNLFIYVLSSIVISFIFKLIFFIQHKINFLPNEWYYKFLYICTLQIAPIFVLWKILFFD